MDQNREWERERGAHAREEAQQHFLALLHDMVRDADASWRKTRKQLRDDSRWELAALLDADLKEKLFLEHIDNLSNKRKRSFKRLLDECEHVSVHFKLRSDLKSFSVISNIIFTYLFYISKNLLYFSGDIDIHLERNKAEDKT